MSLDVTLIQKSAGFAAIASFPCVFSGVSGAAGTMARSTVRLLQLMQIIHCSDPYYREPAASHMKAAPLFVPHTASSEVTIILSTMCLIWHDRENGRMSGH